MLYQLFVSEKERSAFLCSCSLVLSSHYSLMTSSWSLRPPHSLHCLSGEIFPAGLKTAAVTRPKKQKRSSFYYSILNLG